MKYKSDGSIERYKARVVVRGDNQVDRLDYTEPFLLWLSSSLFRFSWPWPLSKVGNSANVMSTTSFFMMIFTERSI